MLKSWLWVCSHGPELALHYTCGVPRQKVPQLQLHRHHSHALPETGQLSRKLWGRLVFISFVHVCVYLLQSDTYYVKVTSLGNSGIGTANLSQQLVNNKRRAFRSQSWYICKHGIWVLMVAMHTWNLGLAHGCYDHHMESGLPWLLWMHGIWVHIQTLHM